MAYGQIAAKIIGDLVKIGTTIGTGIAQKKQIEAMNYQDQINAALQRHFMFRQLEKKEQKEQAQTERSLQMMEQSKADKQKYEREAKVGSQKQVQRFNISNEIQRLNTNPQMREMVIRDMLTMRGVR